MKAYAIAGAGWLLTGLFQAVPPPPMKMGLWETTTTTTVSMPGMQRPSQPTVKMLQCVTPESWAKTFEANQNTSCQRSNETYASGHYTADMTCGRTAKGTGHVDMNFSSPEAGHGTVHMDLDANGHPVTIDTIVDMHFSSASCGDVTPSHPKMER